MNVNQYSKETNENGECGAIKSSLGRINRNSVPNIKLQSDKFRYSETSQQKLCFDVYEDCSGLNKPTTFENYATCKRIKTHRKDLAKSSIPIQNNFCKVHSFLSTPDLSMVNGCDFGILNKNKSPRSTVDQQNSPDIILANENISAKHRFQSIYSKKNQPFHCLHHHQHTQSSLTALRRDVAKDLSKSSIENPTSTFKTTFSTKTCSQLTGEIVSSTMNNEHTINKLKTNSNEMLDRDANSKLQSTISTRF